MTHKMGLLQATIPAEAVADDIITYDGNTYNGSASGEKWTRITASCTTISWNASTTFTSSTNKPYKSGSTLYYLAKPNDNTISISASSGTQLYAWSVSGASTTVSSANRYKTFTIATPDYSNAYNKIIWNFSYAGSYKTWVPPHAGTYTMECWGAQGGDCGWYYGTSAGVYSIPDKGGNGGYAKGVDITLALDNTCYVYVGGKPTGCSGGWNGGGKGSNSSSEPAGSGGGATDIRYNGTNLTDRIIVAGGGGASGGAYTNKARYYGGAGGSSATRTGYNGRNATTSGAGVKGTGASHPGYATDGSLGQGGAAAGNWGAGAGGGGYYGGGGGVHQTPQDSGGGGGGSSYVSNSFSQQTTIAGDASMPNPAGGSNITGRSGNGYARITYTNP